MPRGGTERLIRNLCHQYSGFNDTLEKAYQYLITESLSVSNNKLFCSAFREGVGLKSSVVSNHMKSTKCKLGKERLAKKEATKHDIATAFQS